MITHKAIVKHIGVYVITVDGESVGRLCAATKKDVERISAQHISLRTVKLCPTYCPKKGKVLYPKGHEFQAQDYDRIVELLRAARERFP
jgi:hypothetical protein